MIFHLPYRIMSNTGLDVFLKSPYAPFQETDNHPKHQDFIYTEKRKKLTDLIKERQSN